MFDFQLAADSLPYILQGLGLTLWIAMASFAISLALGMMLALMRISGVKFLSGIARLYISFFRGVPALVILFFIYFGLPFARIEVPATPAAIIGLGLNSAAFTAEVIRAAILGVNVGQWDAAQALGLSRRQTLKTVIFPQAFKLSLPPLSNIILSLIKSTSLAAMITVPEIFQRAKIVGGANFDYMTMYAVVALIYWLICSIYEVFQEKLEQKLSV